jgi:outer membrane protein OmpA-like peptidoglycan-associated protein
LSRLVILLLGALALGALSWLCINKHKPEIEADLLGRSKAALQRAGIGFAAPASIDVRDRRVVKLRGYEASPEISAEAQRIALAERGVAGVEVEIIPRPPAQKAQEQITEVLKLDIVEFLTGSAQLTPKGQATLDKVASVLAQVPDLPVGISGHTDSVGIRASNLDLSRRRAESCRDYLVKKGIAASRLTTEGVGPDKPVDTNDTEAGRQRNRRIEFSVKEVTVKKTV